MRKSPALSRVSESLSRINSPTNPAPVAVYPACSETRADRRASRPVVRDCLQVARVGCRRGAESLFCGVKALIFEIYTGKSTAWEAEQQRIRDEANKKRSAAKTEAVKTQERKAGGKFGPSRGSREPAHGKPQEDKQDNRTATKKAKAAGGSGG